MVIVLVFRRSRRVNAGKQSNSRKSNSVTFSLKSLSLSNCGNEYPTQPSKELQLGLGRLVEIPKNLIFWNL